MARARKYLMKGEGVAYVAYFPQMKTKKRKIDNIMIVQEYPDVFLDGQLGLPPDCQIEFLIYIIHETCPIERALICILCNK